MRRFGIRRLGEANRTYRYFEGKPLYAFGFGLSYPKFNYSDITVSAQSVAAGQPLGADATVTNAGDVAGDEVVQLYLKFPDEKGAPRVLFADFNAFISSPALRRRFTSI